MDGGAVACPQRRRPAPRRRGVQRHLAPVARAHVEGVQVAVEVVGRVLAAAQHEQPRTQRRDGVPDAPGRRLAWAVKAALVWVLLGGRAVAMSTTQPRGAQGGRPAERRSRGRCGALVAGARLVHPGGVPVVLICRQVTLGTWNSHRSLKEDLVVLPPKIYMVSSTAHAQWPLRCAGDLDALCCGTQHIVDRSNQWRSLKQRPGALPGGSTVVTSAALEAANSSPRGSGWAPSGPASAWECRAALSRQARPEEAQEPSGGTLTMLRCHQRRGSARRSARPSAPSVGTAAGRRTRRPGPSLETPLTRTRRSIGRLPCQRATCRS